MISVGMLRAILKIEHYEKQRKVNHNNLLYFDFKFVIILNRIFDISTSNSSI
jgi:hypothetical protein